jgi:hypothetical protein
VIGEQGVSKCDTTYCMCPKIDVLSGKILFRNFLFSTIFVLFYFLSKHFAWNIAITLNQRKNNAVQRPLFSCGSCNFETIENKFA